MTGTGENRRRIGDRLFHIFLGLVFVAMAVELVLLARQNRSLKAELAALESRVASGAGPTLPTVAAGDILEPLNLVNLDGTTAVAAYDDPRRDTLLLIFSPDCPACNQNMPNWAKLEKREDRGLFYVSTADVSRTRSYAEETGLEVSLYTAATQDLMAYRISHIPTTLLVGPGGVVKNVWVGVLEKDTLAEVRAPRMSAN